MKKLVYLIDDDRDILTLLCMVLKKKLFNVIMDFNGNEFDIKNEPCPDIFIIDLQLIDRNGGHLCKLIKHELPHIPVILMSAHFDLESIASESKADYFFAKPFSTISIADMAVTLAGTSA